MNHPQRQGELRLFDAADREADPVDSDPIGPDLGDFPFSGPTVPLLRLRRREREPVPPERCLLGPRCLVCQWRRAGLLDPPADPAEAA